MDKEELGSVNLVRDNQYIMVQIRAQQKAFTIHADYPLISSTAIQWNAKVVRYDMRLA